MIAAQELAFALRQQPWPMSTESALQEELWKWLQRRADLPCAREYRLGPGERIDFFADGIGIEAKVKYPRRQIYRQLERYAAYNEIKALILITGTAIGLPPAINLKPVFLVSLGRAAL